MSERRPFREVKLQWLEQLSCDASLSDNAKCVALHIITRYINGHTEMAWPSYQTIADATGKSVKTIQRAIHDLELGGWFDVVRGNGSRNSTKYRPSENSILQACEAREKTDKIVTLHPDKGGQICPKRRSRVSGKGGQNCHPNLENLKNIKLNAHGDALPREKARSAIPALFIACHEYQKLDRWREWFTKNNLPALEELGITSTRNGEDGFNLPSYYPPDVEDKDRNQTYKSYFKDKHFRLSPLQNSVERLVS